MKPSICRLAIRAVPQASRNAIAGWIGETLKVKVQAPALEGRANEAVCQYLAETLDLPRRAVTLVQGDKSRQKLVEIHGLTRDEVHARLRADRVQ